MNLIFLIILSIIVMSITIYTGTRLYKKTETNFDKRIRDKFIDRDPHMISVMKSITRLGNVETLVVIVIPILFVLIRENEYITASSILISSGLSIFTSQCFKFIFRRGRPTKKREFNYIGYSFPSGHSTVGISFYLNLAYLVSAGTNKLHIMLAIGILIGLLIAFSRIYLGVHWASDVIIGILLGFTCAFWSIYLYNNDFVLRIIFRDC
ncbi:MAG: phosphatase PAP2 family protein [Tissierellia bacterium]|nr:phosphatase PAP2 family protein [Tissierellia bacterium]